MRTLFGVVVVIAAIPVFYFTTMATMPPHCGEFCTFSEVGFPRMMVGAFFAMTTYLTGLGLIADGPSGLTGSDPYADIEVLHLRIEKGDDVAHLVKIDWKGASIGCREN